MFSSGTGRAKANESKYPHIVELAIESDQLDVDLSRRIMDFHRSRHIPPRHGRITFIRGRPHRYRWCFSDLSTANAFVEEFGGAVLQT
jgi:hypothetical protein